MSVRDIDLDPDKAFGIGFPLNYDKEAYGFFTQNRSYYEQLQDNIKTLLMTIKGERLGNPTFGSNLMRVLFEPNEPDILKVKVEETINEALSEYLPFVTLVETKVTNNGHTLNVVAQFDSEFTEEIIEVIVPFASAFADDIEGNTAGGGY